MIIAQISNKEIVRIGGVGSLFPNVSFGPNGVDKKFLDENNCRVVQYSKQHNKFVQKLESCPAYYESGAVYAVKVINMTPDEIAEDKERAMTVLKERRNQLLKNSDWAMLPDSTADKDKWLAYRKQLRDFPATVSDARLSYEFPSEPV